MDISQFNFIDFLLVAVFGFSILMGFGRGLVREVISFLTLIVSIIVAIAFANPVATAFTTSPGVQSALNQASSAIGVNTAQPVSYIALGISFAVLFAGTITIGAIIGFFINFAFQWGMLGIGNRILGAMFGFGRGFILNMVIIFVFQLTPFAGAAWWQQSQLVNSFQPAVNWLGSTIAPGLSNLKDRFGKTLNDMNSSIQSITH